MAFGWAPAAIARATLLCRRSWNRHDTPDARWARAKWLFQKLAAAMGFPAAFGKDQSVWTWRSEPLQVTGQDFGSDGREGDRSHRGRRLGLLAHPLPRLQPDQLLGHAYLASAEVELRPPKADQFAPAHPGVNGEVNQGPVAVAVGLRQVDSLAPVEEHHLTLGTCGGSTRSHGFVRSFCLSTATWSTRRSVR